MTDHDDTAQLVAAMTRERVEQVRRERADAEAQRAHRTAVIDGLMNELAARIDAPRTTPEGD